MIHDLTNGPLALKDGVCVGQFKVYPSHVTVIDSPCSMVGAASSPDSSAPESHVVTSRLSPHLNDIDYPEYRNSLLSLLGANRAAIALPGEPLGLTSLIEHRIDLLPDTRPIYIPAYRLPNSQRAVADQLVQDMID